MTPDNIFNTCNSIAMLGWIILIFLPFWYQSDKFIVGVIITLLAIVYAWLIFSTFSPADAKSFGSLTGVMTLFQDPPLMVAGWVHYLAFDLLAGLFIKKNSLKYGISHWLIIPCLLLTFMLGPIGLLLYLFIRIFYSKDYFAENF